MATALNHAFLGKIRYLPREDATSLRASAFSQEAFVVLLGIPLVFSVPVASIFSFTYF